MGITRMVKGLLGIKPRDIQEEIYKEYQRGLAFNQGRHPKEIMLPKKFGKALPERVVELLLARLSYRPGAKVLDVAHANAMTCHQRLVSSLPEPRHLTGIDIAEPVYDTGALYEKSLMGDVTETQFPANHFNVIWCISALEHFGMDNSGYTENFSVEQQMDVKALMELVRVLAAGGILLVTVPFGKREDHGWFRNYDFEHWRSLIDPVKADATVAELFFGYTPSGWQAVELTQLQNTGYFDHKNSGAAGLAAAIITKAQPS